MAGQNYTDIVQIKDDESSPPVPLIDHGPLASKMKIEELNPRTELLMVFYSFLRWGFLFLSKCQAKTLPHIVTPPHKNVIFNSPMGTGKSINLVMAISFLVDRALKEPQAICIVPNRESAIQIMDWLSKMGDDSSPKCELGLPLDKAKYIPLAKMPPVEAQVIIGTPGTIHKWIAAKKLNIDVLKMFLIDDVDRLLAEPGFKDNVVRIMQDISKKRPRCQVIMSSTKSGDASDAVAKFVTEAMQVPNENEYISITESLDNVELYKVNVPNEASKFLVFNQLLGVMAAGQAIIFVQTIDIARMLCEKLESNRFMYRTLDGARTREQINGILEEFKEKRFQVLISTKTLDRGFDLSQIRLVVFFDLSILLGSSSEPDLEQYSHCIGRGAQLDRKGTVCNLMCGDMDKKIMEKIETLFKVTRVPWSSDVQLEDA